MRSTLRWSIRMAMRGINSSLEIRCGDHSLGYSVGYDFPNLENRSAFERRSNSARLWNRCGRDFKTGRVRGTISEWTQSNIFREDFQLGGGRSLFPRNWSEVFRLKVRLTSEDLRILWGFKRKLFWLYTQKGPLKGHPNVLSKSNFRRKAQNCKYFRAKRSKKPHDTASTFRYCCSFISLTGPRELREATRRRMALQEQFIQ